MSSPSQISYANQKLRWFLSDILYSDTWEKHPENKVLLARVLISRLEDEGYYWQAERLRNHLHRWMASQKCLYAKPQLGDTLSDRERREDSI